MRPAAVLGSAVALLLATGATPPDAVPEPLGVMWPIFPEGHPPSADEIALGRDLFRDPVLSVDHTVSCATCHQPEHGFAEPRAVSIGVGGATGERNAPTLLNTALLDTLGWDGRHPTVEAQTLAAMSNPREMGLSLDPLPRKVRRAYGDRLESVYGTVDADALGRALGAYQRTLLAGDSPFDRYIYAGDATAVGDAERRGFEVFLRAGRCIQCHFMRSDASHPFGGHSGSYTDDRFHNVGVGFAEDGQTADWGRFEVTGVDADRGAFKTPTLRNVALTPPYMHDGSLATLRDVIDHYDRGGVPNPWLDFDIAPLGLDEQQKQDLEAFLRSLTTVSASDAR